MLGITDCCYHAVHVVRLLRKVSPLDWPPGGYGVLVLPPMSARAARVGECFGLLHSLVTQATLGIWRSQVTEVLPLLFFVLSTISSTVNHFNFEPGSHGTTN